MMEEKAFDPDALCYSCMEPGTETMPLQSCMICRRLFCQSCAVDDYGRQFCSAHCRDLFFYGDDEDYDE